MPEFKIVCKPNVPGRLSNTIATGRAKFGTDVVVPNMLFAKFLTSPHGRARIKSIDVSQARALPEVVEIVTLGRSRDQSNASVDFAASD